MRAKTLVGALAALSALATAAAHRPAHPVPAGVGASLHARVRGALHVHTGASPDARGDVETVARDAHAAGLDFVVLADHNTEASLGIDGYRHGVLVLGGIEKSTDSGHAVVLGLQDLPFRFDGDVATLVRDANDLGGFVVAAHPFSSHSEGRWSAALDGVAAIECLNLAEPGAWPHGLGLVLPLLHYVVDPQGALLANLQVSREPLALWDRTLADRPLAGVLGSDAHGGVRAARLWIPIPSYREVFRLAQQHLALRAPLTGDVPRDRALVLDAVREGRGYVALDGLADAAGFRFEARSGGRVASMGEALPLLDEAEIRAEADAPRGTMLVLLRNGRELARGWPLSVRVGTPGSYRVEAWLDAALVPGGEPLPWILSNPIDVYPADALEARRRRAQRLPDPEPEPAAGPSALLDDFASEALAEWWVVDRSSDARGRLVPERGTLRFDFVLGPGPRTHAAAMRWRRQDLSACRSLTFRVRAERRLRFDLQVRTAREAPDGGVRTWRRSVRAETEWRRVSVPLAALKTYDHEGGRPNLGATRSISFHVDEATLRPGTRATLWIDDVGRAGCRKTPRHTAAAPLDGGAVIETEGLAVSRRP